MNRFANLLRDWRDRLLDIRGYFRVRRKFANHSFLADAVASLQVAFRPAKTIYYYPQRPRSHQKSVEYKICALLNVAITQSPARRFDVAFKRKKGTFFDPLNLHKMHVDINRIINAGSLDISKQAVANAFGDVFGYALEVDPTQYGGRIVEKANKNSQHDGRVLQGPITAQDVRPASVYHKEIDNTTGKDDLILDYRLPIHGDQIPLVYLKYRPIATRFSNINSFVALGEPEKLFTTTELKNILLLAQKMGLDYAEIDVLRDKDGRIYVVDVNNTPNGPPNGLPAPECKIALERLSKSFSTLLEQWQI